MHKRNSQLDGRDEGLGDWGTSTGLTLLVRFNRRLASIGDRPSTPCIAALVFFFFPWKTDGTGAGPTSNDGASDDPRQ